MKRMCHEEILRTWRRRKLAISDLLRHATIVTDPGRLEYLNAKVANRKAATEGDLPHRTRQSTPRCRSPKHADSSWGDGSR